MKKLFCLLPILCFVSLMFVHPDLAFAESATDVDSLTTPASDDVSVEVINRLFGDGWQNLYFEDDSSEEANAIFKMLQAFNMVVMAGAAVMLLYIIGQGIIGTAHEGEPLGKKHSTFWTPVRSAFATSLLIPLPWAKGLSLLQALLLAFAYFGIGFADFVWDEGVDYMGEHGGQVTPLTNYDDAKNIARDALITQVIRHYRSQHMDLDAPNIVSEWVNEVDVQNDFSIASSAGESGYMTIYPEPTASDEADGINPGDYGMFTYKCQESTSPLCEGREQGIVTLFEILDEPANKIVQSLDGGEINLDTTAYSDAIKSYNDILLTAMDEQVVNESSEYEEQLDSFVTLAKSKGWAFAGAWYWTIAKYNRKAGEAVSNTPAYQSPHYEKFTDLGSSDLLTFEDLADEYADVSISKMQKVARGHHEKDNIIGSLMSFLNRPFATVDPIETLGLDQDPILALQSVGNKIITATVATVTAIEASRLASAGYDALDEGGAGWFASKIPVIGDVYKVTSAVAKQLLKDVWTIGLFLVIPLFVLGMTLAYYLPAVPFVLFTSAFIGWIILLIESIVAAPLWAASHVEGSDEGITGQKGKTGYMLFLGILMRPVLMVMGFFASYMIFSAVGKFLHESFSVFAAGLRAGFGISGFFTMMAMVIIIGSLTIVYAHKLFGLVTWLPDNVLKWIGQQVQNLGEQQDQAKSESHFSGGAGFVYNAGGKANRQFRAE